MPKPKRAEKPQIDSDYFASVLAKPLHPLYAELEPHLPNGGTAIDLGCGVGTGTLWLAEKGYQVFAIDNSEEAIEILRQRLEGRTSVKLKMGEMQSVPFPKADVIVASFSLFLLNSDDFKKVWSKIKRSLKPGGVFMGQFLGKNDEWASYSLTLTRQEVARLFRGMDKLYMDEVEREGKTVLNESKHWHVFHVIARKRYKSS